MKHIILATLLLFSGVTNAQSASIPNVLKLKDIKQSGEIIENDKIVGYFVFYFKEKEDRKTVTYEVEIFDDNYNSMRSFEITRPRNSYLMETVYNGEVFLLFFYDNRNGYEYVTVDKSGEVVGSKKIPTKEISNYDVQRSAQALQSGGSNVTFYPLGNEGFVRQGMVKNKKLGYEIVAYDNDMNELWKYGSSGSSMLVESVEIGQVSTDFIGATVQRKKSLMTKKYDSFFLLLDAESGEEVTEIAMGDSDAGKLSILKNYADEANNSIILIGEYYAPGDDVLKDKSQGLFLKEISEDGSEISMNQYAWKDEIADYMKKNLSEDDNKKAKQKSYLYFHDVIRSENGNLFLIAEQFKKQISAGATAANLLVGATGGSSDVSNFELRLGDMVVIEFDQEYKLQDYTMISKKSTSVFLPQGAGFWNPSFIGYYVKYMGWFDYSFTSRDADNDSYSVIYVDANRKEEKDDKNTDKADKMLGLIHISGGEMSADRVPINTEAKTWWISPAKPGNISIMEYYKKEKRLDMRLEPLTYE